MHTSTSIKEFVERFIATWNAHDADGVAALYATDFHEFDVAQAAPQVGRDHMRRKVLAYLRAFPDLQVDVDACLIEGDRVAVFWRWHGTHMGTFMRIPPTGKAVAVRGSSLLMVADGQIRSAQRIWDLAGLLRCIGLLPEL